MDQLPPAVTSSHSSKASTAVKPFWQRKWVRNGLPLATSIAVHLGLVIVGLIVVFSAARFMVKTPFANQIIIPDATVTNEKDLGAPNSSGPEIDFNRQAMQQNDPASTSKSWAQTHSDLRQLQGGGGDADDVIANGLGNGPGKGDTSNGTIGHALGFGTGDGTGDEAIFGRHQTGGGSGDGDSIFPRGTPDIKSICYICDGSGSLVGGKDEALRVELKKAVSRLEPTQAFNVFIFQEGEGGKMFQSLDTRLLMAKPTNQGKLYDLVDNKLSFHGSTNPIPALEEAWRENPQLVYLLTDGEFDDPDSAHVMARIKELNDARKKLGQPIVKVNTILLVEKHNESYPEFEALMKKIADDNGGIYKKHAAEDLD